MYIKPGTHFNQLRFDQFQVFYDDVINVDLAVNWAIAKTHLN